MSLTPDRPPYQLPLPALLCRTCGSVATPTLKAGASRVLAYAHCPTCDALLKAFPRGIVQPSSNEDSMR
jgi:hypothetical protein